MESVDERGAMESFDMDLVVAPSTDRLSMSALRALESGHRADTTTALLLEEEIARSDLEGLDDEDNLLGKGCFGEVRRVTWRKTPAAAKVAFEQPGMNKQLVLRELQLMCRCRHPNIVQFLGYVDSPFVIVMELILNGDLRNYWSTRRVGVGHKMCICIDVVRLSLSAQCRVLFTLRAARSRVHTTNLN